MEVLSAPNGGQAIEMVRCIDELKRLRLVQRLERQLGRNLDCRFQRAVNRAVVGENSVHGSDAEETARFELTYFFAGYELE